MALDIKFGNGGHSSVKSLQQTLSAIPDLQLLDDQTLVSTAANTAGQILAGDGNIVDVDKVDYSSTPISGALSGTGGKIGYEYDPAAKLFVFEATGAWNSVKNAFAVSDTNEHLTFDNIVHTDVYLGGEGTSVVNIVDAKRGIIETGSGADKISIALLTNNAGWQNEFTVRSGAGNDQISFTTGTARSNAKVTDGKFTTAIIDAGEGDDVIDLSAVNFKGSVVSGGTGYDLIIASQGKDVFTFAQGDSQDGDLIKGFGTGDKINLYGSKDDWTIETGRVKNGVYTTYIDHVSSGDSVEVQGSVDLALIGISNSSYFTFQDYSDII